VIGWWVSLTNLIRVAFSNRVVVCGRFSWKIVNAVPPVANWWAPRANSSGLSFPIRMASGHLLQLVTRSVANCISASTKMS